MSNIAPRGGGYQRPRQATDRKKMLDLSREGHFKYDLKDVLAAGGSIAPEQVAGFVATVCSKGGRQSTIDAKDWVTQKFADNVITKAERGAINTLLDRYSKYR